MLEGDDGKEPLRFASVYGFRNIQALVQKMKRHQCSYDYIEVMACPSGCLNGGGQPKQRLSDAAELLQLVEEAHQQVRKFTRQAVQREDGYCFRTSS